jgi:hypothetical protein
MWFGLLHRVANKLIVPNHIRAKGLALSIAVIALTDLVYLQVTATVSPPCQVASSE